MIASRLAVVLTLAVCAASLRGAEAPGIASLPCITAFTLHCVPVTSASIRSMSRINALATKWGRMNLIATSRLSFWS